MIPSLTTERLILRPVKPEDNESLFALRSDPEQMRFIPRPLAQTIADADKLLNDMLTGIENNTSINWAATIKGNDRCIGVMGFYRIYPEHFRAEVGYMLLPEHQRKGLMQEALAALVNYGFTEMNLHTVEAVTDPENIASQKVLLNLGFVKEAHFKENIFFNNRFMDSVHYTLFRTRQFGENTPVVG